MVFKTIIGISAYYHDSAIALIINGEIKFAAQEERYTREKNTAAFPFNAIRSCLEEFDLTLAEVDAVVFYEKPFLKLERIIQNFYEIAPNGFMQFMPFFKDWTTKKLFLKNEIRKKLREIDWNNGHLVPVFFSSHHLSHAASAFFPSPFGKAAILTVDAVGEWATASIGQGDQNKIVLEKTMNFPNSVGILYSSFTYFLGFSVNSGEYKMMGLAPLGDLNSDQTKKFIAAIKKELVTVFNDGSIKLNQHYFKYRSGLKMIRKRRWEQLFGSKKKPNESFNQRHKNIALAIQTVLEEIILKMAITAKKLTGSSNLCLAGGVALNSVATGKLVESKIFDQIWIQPAAGDAGGALGAALAFYYSKNDRFVSAKDKMNHGFIGPAHKKSEILGALRLKKLKYEYFDEEFLLNQKVAKFLAKDKVVGWVKGRLEFGPRALGGRSILASPKSNGMKDRINKRIKFREDFRPFAPVMLSGEAEKYFNVCHDASYMQYVHRITENQREVGLEQFPSVLHGDSSARIQTVTSDEHPLYGILNAFKVQTGIGMLINTSFNRNKEPIVQGLESIIEVFLMSDIDILVIDNFFIKNKNV